MKGVRSTPKNVWWEGNFGVGLVSTREIMLKGVPPQKGGEDAGFGGF